MNKQEIIEKLKRVIFLLEDNDEYDHHVAALNEAIQSLPTEPQVDKVTAEYKTQLVIPVQVKNQNYCDLDGKIIPTDFIIDKEHFFHGGYGYIVVDNATQSNAEAIKKELHRRTQLILSEPNGAVRETMIATIGMDLFDGGYTNAEAMREHAIGLLEAVESARNNYQVLNEQYVVSIHVLDVIIQEFKDRIN